MIAVDHLSKRFNGSVAVDDVSFTVGAGELFALLGPNGAGKTTTINCLLGFLAPDGGTLRIANADVTANVLEARRYLAYIPEQVSLYCSFSGLENLRYLSKLADHRYAEAELRRFLDEAGLQSAAHDRRVSTYSKGMRQKVGIAVALAKKAQVLLLDEPTSGLDPAASHEFSRLLRALRERGVAILMATHDLFRAKEDATTVGLMRHGRQSRTDRHGGEGETGGRVPNCSARNSNRSATTVGVQPFGGSGLSGTGPKAGGPRYLLRFMAERTLTINTAAIGGDIDLVS